MSVALGFIPIQLFMPKVENCGCVIAPANEAPLIDRADGKL